MGTKGLSVLAVLTVLSSLAGEALAQCPKFVEQPMASPLHKGDRLASFRSGLVARVESLATDADGASGAYRPDGRGLDLLCNAVKAYVGGRCLDVRKEPGRSACNSAVAAAQKASWARAKSPPMCVFGFEAPTKDAAGELPLWGGKFGNGPLPIQTEADPSPGAFISVTSSPVKVQPGASRTTAYANSDVVPFVVAPSRWTKANVVATSRGAAAIVRVSDLHATYAVVGDTRNDDAFGEVSIAAVQMIADPSLVKPVLPPPDARSGDPLPTPYVWRNGVIRAVGGPSQGPYLVLTFGRKSGVVTQYDLASIHDVAKAAADAQGGVEFLARCALEHFGQK